MCHRKIQRAQQGQHQQRQVVSYKNLYPRYVEYVCSNPKTPLDVSPPDSRVGRADRWDDQPEQRESERTWQIIDALIEVSRECGKSTSQVALNWLLQQPGVTAPIIGARTLTHLEDNLGSVGWSLEGEQLAKLSAASDIPLPSPYNFIARYTRKRL